MQADPANPSPDDLGESLPPRTTPTWEMELLLSGATVFALLQAYAALAPRAPELAIAAGQRAMPLLLPLLLYLQAAILALSGGLLIHLLLRAFWIALVGLRSVDPAGRVRTSRALGPWQRARVGEAWDALPARIAALDDRATVVFAVALGLARLMGQLFVYASLLVLLGVAIDFASGSRLPAATLFPVLVVVLLAPMLVAVALDNRAGRRGTSTPAWAQRVLAVYSRIGMTAQHSLSLQVLVHRLGGGGIGGRMGAFALVLVLMVVTTLLPLVLRGELTMLIRSGFPQLSIGAAESVRFSHYDALSPDTRLRRTPSIPAAQVEGHWLPLFVPWVDEWHAAPLAACSAPHGEDWIDDAGRATTVLACMAKAQPITLDGTAIGPDWLFTDDGGEGRRGFLAMIDLRSLPAGRHLLTIQPPPAGRDADDPDQVWRIPFWN